MKKTKTAKRSAATTKKASNKKAVTKVKTKPHGKKSAEKTSAIKTTAKKSPAKKAMAPVLKATTKKISRSKTLTAQEMQPPGQATHSLSSHEVGKPSELVPKNKETKMNSSPEMENTQFEIPLEATVAPKSTWPRSVIMYTDGASRGNPGPSSLGVYVTDAKGTPIFEHGRGLGHQTNNYAEYMALVDALKLAEKNGAEEVLIRADSELMIRQLLGQYKVKSEALQPLFRECMTLARKFRLIRFEHVRREFNKQADRLANEALDRF